MLELARELEQVPAPADVIVDLVFYAATHGRGAYVLTLPRP